MTFEFGALWRPARKARPARVGPDDGRADARPATDGPQPAPGDGLADHWTEIDGLPMYARVTPAAAPEAPVVVLVHGLVVSSWYMAPTAIRLAPRYRALAPDLPGFGRSGTPPRALTVPELADALVDWMSACGIASAALVGNSLGCQVTADAAARYPERVERLVLLGPTMDAHARTPVQQTIRLFQDMLRESPTNPWKYARDIVRTGARRGLRTFRYGLDDRIEEKLPHIRVPALVVRGERDPICPLPWAEEVARCLPLGRLVTIPGGAHALNASAPDAFVRVLRPFLAPMDARRPALPGRSPRLELAGD